jgi:hypothetical protein
MPETPIGAPTGRDFHLSQTLDHFRGFVTDPSQWKMDLEDDLYERLGISHDGAEGLTQAFISIHEKKGAVPCQVVSAVEALIQKRDDIGTQADAIDALSELGELPVNEARKLVNAFRSDYDPAFKINR